MKTLYAFALLLCCQFINAQTSGSLYYLSSTTGAGCYEIEYHNHRIYAGAGNTLLVYDTTLNATPGSIAFEYRFTSTISDIKFRGNYMYIAVNHAGLSVWDVSGTVPVLTDEFQPTNLTEAAYDIAFKGADTIFVAYKSKMAIFSFNGSALSLLSTFATQVSGTYVMGCDVKNNLLAFVTAAFDTTAAGNSRTGVHICDAVNPATQYSFFQQDSCDPEDVMFGQNTDLLHVMGGTDSWASTNSVGIYYALNISNPALPSLIFLDALPHSFFFNIAQPMNGELRNDTLFIATQGAWDQNTSLPLHGYVYAYDCTNNNVSFINELDAGLWHFDLALDGNRMFIASEWYGVKTLDISDIMNEVDLGNTLTGGWNLSADVYGNRLVLANEGYGFKYFDFTNPMQPTLLRPKVDTGFCQGISFSKDGSHIFGWYYTVDDFRVFDTTSNFNVTASVPLTSIADYFDPCTYQDFAIADQRIGFNHYFVSMDVSNYNAPFMDTTFLMGGILYRDMCVTNDGYLYVATTGTIKVYDLNNNYALVTSTNAPLFQTFSCIAVYNDTLYTYIDNGTQGIRKYFFNGATLSFISGNTALTVQKPKFIAVDSFGLYADYQEEGLYAYDKNTMAQIGYYRHSMEFYRPTYWGQQQLFCKQGYIFDVEYQGQTSILTMNSLLTSQTDNPEMSDENLSCYPNPVAAGEELIIVDPDAQVATTVEIFDAQGRLVTSLQTAGEAEIHLSTDGLNPGIYFFTIITTGINSKHGKFIVD